MKPTHSANRNSSSTHAAALVRVARMRLALAEEETTPVCLVVARFFKAA